jgi:aminoglycoside phosphotransferase (APT) family kinase protein
MNLEDCLPPALRGATITRVAAGLSGAGVYRVGDAHVLRVHDAPLAHLALLRLASDAGLAPRLVHVDEARNAIVSEYVEDRGFAMLMVTPSSRDHAIALLGELLREVHALPLPPGGVVGDARTLLADIWPELAGLAVPAFVAPSIQAVLDEVPPPDDRVVVSHNAVDPTNLVFDGKRLLLVDWSASGPNDPTYDLAGAAVFLRLDARPLFEAYDGSEPSPRYFYNKRLVAALAGAMFLRLAKQAGYPGGDGEMPLAELDAKCRTGEVDIARPEGQWQFGVALLDVSRSS